MKDTDEILGMIKEEGADFFLNKGKYKINVGIYLEQLMEERGVSKKEVVHRLNLEESYGRKLFSRAAGDSDHH